MAETNEQVVPEVFIPRASEQNELPIQFIFYKAHVSALNKDFYGTCPSKIIDVEYIKPTREISILKRENIITSADTVEYEIIKVFDNITDAVVYSALHTETSYIPEDNAVDEVQDNSVVEETE